MSLKPLKTNLFNKKNRWRLFGLVGGALAVVALAAGYYDYRRFLDAPLTAPAGKMAFVIAAGESNSSIAERLQAQGVIRSALYWRAYARQSGLGRRIQAGEYALTADATPRTLLEQFAAGRVIQHSLTIVEGWTFRQLLAAIAAHPKLQHTLTGLSDADIMTRLGQSDQRPEGRFFPDTYYFPAGLSDLKFLERAYATMERRLQDAWRNRPSDLPLQTPYEALILASLIEKETGQAGERREIAGVFIRRLRQGMLLQTDPSVIYGLGERYDGNLRRQDLQQDTLYNTYLRRGLPPTPIALPGAAALAAAVDPAAGDALYFVATGDGGHVFSRTLEEHNQKVRQYQLNRR